MPTFPISGVDVHFPFKPYPPQIAMMCKIINALKKKENALIESPTGTGKTLALLCSALAWQNAEYENAENLLIQERKCFNLAQRAKQQHIFPTDPQTAVQDDDDFVETTKIQTKEVVAEPVKIPPVDLNDPNVFRQKLFEARKNVPKIFFGSRTHKQLIQVIRELNRTEYRGVKMTILGSREQTCINTSVKQAPDRNEACKSLLRNEHGMSCPFYQKLKKFENNTNQLRKVIKNTHLKFMKSTTSPNNDFVEDLAWDIEDIVKIGEDQRFCPHFAITSVLLQDASLIFCPYNYLIDPLIREKIKLEMQGQIILLDEAHNIEDSCRDATSFCVLEEELVNSRDAFDAAGGITLGDDYPTAAYQAFAELSKNFLTFLRRSVENKDTLTQQSHGSYYRLWSGPEIIATFKELGVTEERYQQFLKYERDIYDSLEATRSESRTANSATEKVMPTISMGAMEQILTFCQFLFKDNCKFMEDFKMTVTRQNPELFDSSSVKKNRKSDAFGSKPIVALKIWCLNPGVAFCDVGAKSWSVILASGTLSPLDTFESELGVAFKKAYRLEAAHVLPPDRMFVRSIGVGPHNKALRATHQFMYGDEFLDEFGFVLSGICATVPGGVLCFLPSYRFLETVAGRWKQTGLWNELSSFKCVITEPKGNASLKEAMESFYEVVDRPYDYSATCTGGLFFAVYRGKISEGLDFADDYARVVVCVGIPFPNFMQTEVKMKREYNNRYASTKKLLKGDQWYEIQAYRALNQALGRCLRHRNDWGSLLLIDERFRSASYTLKLSKWIRSSIVHCDRYNDLLADLKSFTEKLSNGDAKNAFLNVGCGDDKISFLENELLSQSVNDSVVMVSNDSLKSMNVVENLHMSGDVAVEDSWSNSATNSRSLMLGLVDESPRLDEECLSKYFHCQEAATDKKRYSFVKRRRFAVFNNSLMNDGVERVVLSQTNTQDSNEDVSAGDKTLLNGSPIFLEKFVANSSTPLCTSVKRKIFSFVTPATVLPSTCLNDSDF